MTSVELKSKGLSTSSCVGDEMLLRVKIPSLLGLAVYRPGLMKSELSKFIGNVLTEISGRYMPNGGRNEGDDIEVYLLKPFFPPELIFPWLEGNKDEELFPFEGLMLKGPARLVFPLWDKLLWGDE